MNKQPEISYIVNTKINNTRNKVYESFITILDVECAIDRLNSGKSGGHDGICTDMYKHGKNTALVLFIKLLLNQIFTLGYIPNDFNVSVITPIPKSSKFSLDPADYRPISVSSVIALVFEDIIRQKICLRPHDNQFGFRSKTSTKHAYLAVNETIKYYSANGTQCWVASLDATKAFDRLWRDGLFFQAYR